MQIIKNATRSPLQRIGLIVIGRNEGDRLKKCLTALPKELGLVVYVDSDSIDDSVTFAKGHGFEVVSLDTSIPFTAGRARNAGFKRLTRLAPHLEFVQFLDGDCEILPGWFDAVLTEFDSRQTADAICGKIVERHPEQTAYNLICDIEWRIPPTGVVKNFGGIVAMKVESFKRLHGFDPNIIAAEDDDLSIRLRKQGGQIIRLNNYCALHDSNMTKFSQWWLRAKRCGHGYAQIFTLHGNPPEYYFFREVCSSLFWAGIWPIAILGLSALLHQVFLLLFASYPIMSCRIFRNMKKLGYNHRESFFWSLSCMTAKFPQLIGIFTFLKRLLVMKQFKLIEYKR